MEINWTTVIASAVTAVIVGGSQFVFTRYLGRMLDRIEREMVKKDGNGKSGDGTKHP